MNTRMLSFLLLFCFAALIEAQVSFGKSEKINNSWKFSLADNEQAATSSFNDNRWQSVDLPHDWSEKGQLSPTLASCTGYSTAGCWLIFRQLEKKGKSE